MSVWRPTYSYEAMPGPWLSQSEIDHNISRIGIFVVCCLTLVAFYFGLVKLPISHMAATQQLPSISNPLDVKRSPTAVASAAPSAPATTAAASSAPAVAPTPFGPPASAAASVSPAAPASAAPVVSARPRASALSAPAPSHSAAAATASGSYTVQAGDTLTSIARRYNVPVQTIAGANKLADAGTLKAGQKLDIP